jgi:hypothetical protein
MVVEDREGTDSLSLDLQRPFEVELPELIRCGAFEGLDRLGWRFALEDTVTVQDALNGVDAGELELFLLHEVGPDLSGSPAVAGPDSEDLVFEFRRGLVMRAAERSARPVLEGVLGFGAAASEPLVGGLSADAKLPADLGNGFVEFLNLIEKRETDIGHRMDFPGHSSPL